MTSNVSDLYRIASNVETRKEVASVIKFRAVLAVLVLVVYGYIYKVYHPIWTQAQALRQMEDSPASFTAYQSWIWVWNVGWVVLILFAIWLLWPAFKAIGKKLSELD